MEYPRIGNIQLDGFALLAPMAGVSDLAYRVIARKMGAALTTAEMVSAKGLYYHNEKTKDMLKIAEEEHPVSLQLFGSDPAVMALGAKVMEKAGADIVDINMGCPMQKVVKNGDGSALMKNVTLAAEIISAVTAAVKIPVTVKMRLGWSRDTINAVELAFHFMDFLAVHTRIFYLFTKVNYTNFHVSLCFNIFYKDKKKQSTQTDNNTLIINNITNKQQGIV